MKTLTQFFQKKENEKPNEKSGKPKQAAKKASGKPKQAAKKAGNCTIKKGNGLTIAQKAASKRALVKKTPGLRNSNRVVLDDANQKRFYKQLAQGAIGSYDPMVVYDTRIQNLVITANRQSHVSGDLRSAIWKRDYSLLIELVKKLNTKNKANEDELLHALQTLKSNTGMKDSVDLADAFPGNGNETLRELANKIPSLKGAAVHRTKRKIQVHVATLLKDLVNKVAPGDSEAEQKINSIIHNNAAAIDGMTTNTRRKKSNDLAKAAEEAAAAKQEEYNQAVEEGLPNVKKLKQELDEALLKAREVKDNSTNGKVKARRKKSNDLAKAAEEAAAAKQEEYNQAVEEGLPNVKKLKQELDEALLKAREAKDNSTNGKVNARRKKSNDLAKVEKAAAVAKRKEYNQAVKEGRPNVKKLKQEADEADLKAKEAYEKSANGRKNAERSRKFTFADEFVLDRRTLFVGLDDAIAKRVKYMKNTYTRNEG